MTEEEFMTAFGDAYEHSPWAAERVFGADINSSCRVISAMRKMVDAASNEEQDALIKAHPNLAGKLALSGGLTVSSTKEQAGAGLDQCSPRELAKFQKYNTAYQAKFGFPFIVAVKGLSRKDILKASKKRLKNTETQERKAALEQVHKIAAFRIEEWFKHDKT